MDFKIEVRFFLLTKNGKNKLKKLVENQATFGYFRSEQKTVLTLLNNTEDIFM